MVAVAVVCGGQSPPPQTPPPTYLEVVGRAHRVGAPLKLSDGLRHSLGQRPDRVKQLLLNGTALLTARVQEHEARRGYRQGGRRPRGRRGVVGLTSDCILYVVPEDDHVASRRATKYGQRHVRRREARILATVTLAAPAPAPTSAARPGRDAPASAPAPAAGPSSDSPAPAAGPTSPPPPALPPFPLSPALAPPQVDDARPLPRFRPTLGFGSPHNDPGGRLLKRGLEAQELRLGEVCQENEVKILGRANGCDGGSGQSVALPLV